MQWVITKAQRRLLAVEDGQTLFTCRVALGRVPTGAKERECDGRTPEGRYRICFIKEQGKYGRSLGLSYPGEEDARRAYADGRIDRTTLTNILAAHVEGRRPPWGSPLGGEIYVHEGGSATDWTQGCIAVDKADMDWLFMHWEQVGEVVIK